MASIKDPVYGMMAPVEEGHPTFHHAGTHNLWSDLFLRAFLAVGLLLVLQGCGETAVQRMINANDHRGLATYYAQQAQELRAKAKAWETTAESYEKHSEPHGKIEPKQHAAHCRAIAHNYAKAADEADELAREHRAMSSAATMQ